MVEDLADRDRTDVGVSQRSSPHIQYENKYKKKNYLFSGTLPMPTSFRSSSRK